jgi:hypothetical protein
MFVVLQGHSHENVCNIIPINESFGPNNRKPTHIQKHFRYLRNRSVEAVSSGYHKNELKRCKKINVSSIFLFLQKI